jgi:hypothetical protein
MDPMDTAALDAAIDALYQAPLDRFTADRNALAADLRKRGDRAAADRVKALAKPSVTAWAVNQVWWRDREAFDAMLAAGVRLRDAHIAFAQGESADVRVAMEDRQRAVTAVIDAAVTALGGPAEVTPDARHRIQGTVEALASNGMPEDVAAGRLTADLQASGLAMLGTLAGLGPSAGQRPAEAGRHETGAALRVVEGGRRDEVPEGPADAGRHDGKTRRRDERDRPQADKAQEHARRIADARARLADREVALRAAATDHAASVAAQAKARASLERLTTQVADLEQQLDAAREQEREARRTLTQATKTASEAEMMRARTSRDVDAARAALDELEKGPGR